MEAEVCLSYRRVTQELTLWLVGMIGRPTDHSTNTWLNSPFGIAPPTPLHGIPGQIGENRMMPPEPRPTSRLKCPLQSVPGGIQGVTTDAGSSAGIRDSVVRWRDKVPKRWDRLNAGGNFVQEGEVSDSYHSCLMYHLTYLQSPSRKGSTSDLQDVGSLEGAMLKTLPPLFPNALGTASSARVEFYDKFQREADEYDRDFTRKCDEDLGATLTSVSVCFLYLGPVMALIRLLIFPHSPPATLLPCSDLEFRPWTQIPSNRNVGTKLGFPR